MTTASPVQPDLLPGMESLLESPEVAPAGGIEAVAHAPTVATKELAINAVDGRRRVRLSSNLLALFGFPAGARHDVAAIPGGGLRVTSNPEGRQHIYRRAYAARRNNPFESVLEIGAQSLVAAAIPEAVERLHFTLRHGDILVRPVVNRAFHIRKAHRLAAGPLAAFVAMTGGIDAHCLHAAGFDIDALLEYRPQEKRDSRDLTEVNAMNALGNVPVRVLFNEDISTVDMDTVREHLAGAPATSLLHISLQCDDFSCAKAQKFKDAALADLSTSRDLVYDALRLVETVRPAAVMVENVPAFANSAEGQLLAIKLRKFGYHITTATLAGDRFGGLTGRRRHYLVASVFKGFAMPAEGPARTAPVWNDIAPLLAGCRDVSHTVSLRKGLEGGRARILDCESIVAPTVLKSQNRQTKDAVYVGMPDGSYRLPSGDMLRRLNGIPESVNLNNVAGDIASEIIGQSIEYPMHHAIAVALHAHLAEARRAA